MISIKLSELNGLTEEEIAEKLQPLIDASFRQPTQADLDRVEQRIKAYEEKYGMTTEEMLEKIINMEIPELEDHVDWAFDWEHRQRIINALETSLNHEK